MSNNDEFDDTWGTEKNWACVGNDQGGAKTQRGGEQGKRSPSLGQGGPKKAVAPPSGKPKGEKKALIEGKWSGVGLAKPRKTRRGIPIWKKMIRSS